MRKWHSNVTKRHGKKQERSSRWLVRWGNSRGNGISASQQEQETPADFVKSGLRASVCLWQTLGGFSPGSSTVKNSPWRYLGETFHGFVQVLEIAEPLAARWRFVMGGQIPLGNCNISRLGLTNVLSQYNNQSPCYTRSYFRLLSHREVIANTFA